MNFFKQPQPQQQPQPQPQPQPQLYEFYPNAPRPGEPSILPSVNDSLDTAKIAKLGFNLFQDKNNPLSIPQTQYRSQNRLQQKYYPNQNIVKNPDFGITSTSLVRRAMSQKRQRGLQNRFTARMKNRLAARIARSRNASRGTTFYGGEQTRSKQMLHNISQRLTNAFGLRRQQMGGNKRKANRSEKRSVKRSEKKKRKGRTTRKFTR
jgi:hypothetical protein